MYIRSLLRSAATLSMLASLAVYVAAQDVRDASAFAQDGTGTVEQQYYVLFRRLVNPPPPPNRPQSESTDQINQPPRPRPDFRAMFHRSAHLTDVEARLLDQIAEDCVSKTNKFDEQAHEIIAARRAELRAGKVPPTTPPPSELSDLQKQRDGVIRNAIEQLRAGFGDEEFKRLNDQVVTNTGTSRATLPPPSQKALPIEVRLALLNSDPAAKPRFSVKDGFTVEVSMLNNSTKMISIKPSELLQWLLLTDPSETDTLRPVPRNLLMMNPALLHPPDEATIDLPPNQLQVVSRFKFGAGGILIRPGEYQLSVHPRVLLNREPSEFLQLSLAQPIVFEVIP